ncbi:hypothetical protein LAZ67_9000026 [Cordylochernes scorpioides]|uniref:Helix-turn-helix domain-containing protein n=1 Tax=Cordylochernes scorpioides TaxID=51811 RepID=A0ABY6KS46_9ARAC|nr:hypothetical protein LAZ67_9000026 [Cordylochernes scorpioides]
MMCWGVTYVRSLSPCYSDDVLVVTCVRSLSPCYSDDVLGVTCVRSLSPCYSDDVLGVTCVRSLSPCYSDVVLVVTCVRSLSPCYSDDVLGVTCVRSLSPCYSDDVLGVTCVRSLSPCYSDDVLGVTCVRSLSPCYSDDVLGVTCVRSLSPCYSDDVLGVTCVRSLSPCYSDDVLGITCVINNLAYDIYNNEYYVKVGYVTVMDSGVVGIKRVASGCNMLIDEGTLGVGILVIEWEGVSRVLQRPLPLPPNSQTESKALRRLMKQRSIVISRSDKGTDTVILDRSSYHAKILEILQDTATFSQISAQESTIALKTFKSSLNRMKRSSLISTEEHKSFTTNLPNGTYIYGLPKVHKPSVPLRPIIAYHLSPAYPLAKYLSNYLSPLLNNNRSNLTVSSTPTLIQEITGLHPPPKLHHVLPHHLIIDSLNQFLVSINTDPVKTNSITSLSQICLNMSTFTFDHIHFKQIRGSPMGSPLSSIAAELVMTRIDKWVCNLHCDDILFWRRYVDDILCICKTDLEETILSTLNSYNPLTSQQGHIIPFLDILIIRTPASFHTTVYYKNSSTPTYTHFNSFCPIVHKINIVKTLTRRLHTHCSLPIFKTTEKARIISHLTAASYPLTFINKHTYSPAPSNPPPVFRTTCMLPYSPLTVSISRLIRPFGIRTFFINTPSIHSLLRHPITKTGTQLSPLDSSGAVYSVSCEHCSATYVGETGRTVAIRMSEHTRNINNNDPRSLIYQHVASTGHSFNTNHPTIHYRNIPNLHQRLMLESIVSTKLKSINRKIEIPEIYDIFVSS